MIPCRLAALIFLLSLFGGWRSLTFAQSNDPISNEAELAIRGFRIPDGMLGTVFAAEPDVANPVAFAIGRDGRMFVCETFRQQKGVEDNRGHMDWLLDDLSLTAVEQRHEMFEKHLGDKVAEYGMFSDRIRLLEDTDGDGQVDSSQIFADGFNDVLDGTGAGVLPVGDDVWYTCIPYLWRLTDTDGDGSSDKREAISSGYGVRVAFRGHDMHGLIRGPDGRIYFSIGDRGFNVTTAEGRHLFHPDTGAVFRCEPDGSNLEVFAYGLRNPQELAFDNYGNLFTVDNNSDGGDQARLTYVAQGGDIGWRMYYQYLPDRGPWNRERMWYPYRADDETSDVQPAYIVPPIVNISDGPSGFVSYPGVGLPDRYDGHFFLADFRGTAGNSGIRTFGVAPHGATFEMVDQHEFLWSILATDVDFGFDGRMYVSDWVDGWDGTGKGRIYAFQHQRSSHSQTSLEMPRFMSEGVSTRPAVELARLLSHADRRIRQAAQFELAERNDHATLVDVARDSDHEFARLHALWGLGQIARRDATVVDVLVRFLAGDDVEIRAQAARLLYDVVDPVSAAPLVTLLQQGGPREQYFAALTLGKTSTDVAAEPILQMLDANKDADPLLRHAGVMGLTQLAQQHGAEFLLKRRNLSTSQRLAIVLVLRRLKHSALTEFLNDADWSIVVETARAIHDLDISPALPELASLRLAEKTPDALARRVMNANYRLGTAAHAATIAEVAKNTALPDSWRLHAIEMLTEWDDPPVLNRVTNQFRPLTREQKLLARLASAGAVPALLSEQGTLQKAAVKLAGVYKIEASSESLVRIVRDPSKDAQLRTSAILALSQFDSLQVAPLVSEALKSEVPELRIAARTLLADRDPQAATVQLESALHDGTTTEQQQAISTLATIKLPQAGQVLEKWMKRLVHGDVPPEIQLDLLTAAHKHGGQLDELATQFDAQQPADDKLAAYRVTLHGGDVERGREVFFGRAAASCRRCHKVAGEGSDVGPDLSGVAKGNSREYLLQSIVDPNAKIAKGYETVVFLMDDGRVITGIVRDEDDYTYRLMQSTGEMLVVSKSQIDEQAKGQSGMPADLIKSLSRADIRDLVEYLSTLKTPAKTGDSAPSGQKE